MPKIVKECLLNMVLMLASLVVFFIISEVSVRGLQFFSILKVLDKNSIALSAPEINKHNAKLQRSENKKLALEYDKNDPAINSYGMRDQEYNRQAPEGVRRVAVIGDSVTFGLGVALDKTYVKGLQARINERPHKSRYYQFMNFGVSGYSSESELEFFKQTARQFNPEVVVVGYVMNDPIPTARLFSVVAKEMEESKDFGRLAKKSQVLAWIKMKWKLASEAVTARGVYEEFYDPQGEYWNSVVESFKGFKALSEQDEFKLVVVVFPMLYDFKDYPFTAYHEQALSLFKQLEIDYIDLMPVFNRYQASDFRIVKADATHPNELGHRLAAEEIDRYFQDVLR